MVCYVKAGDEPGQSLGMEKVVPSLSGQEANGKFAKFRQNLNKLSFPPKAELQSVASQTNTCPARLDSGGAHNSALNESFPA